MEKLHQMAPNGARRIFVPTNPDLADVLGRMDLDFFGPQISGLPGPQISRFPDYQVPRYPDAAAGAGRILRSQPDPSPNAPRDQIRRKGPCCD